MANEKISRRIAEKIAEEVGFDVDVRLSATGLTVAQIISTELEPVMEVLREALEEKSGHVHHCAIYFQSQSCNCWVSRAEALIDGEK